MFSAATVKNTIFILCYGDCKKLPCLEIVHICFYGYLCLGTPQFLIFTYVSFQLPAQLGRCMDISSALPLVF